MKACHLETLLISEKDIRKRDAKTYLLKKLSPLGSCISCVSKSKGFVSSAYLFYDNGTS